MNLTYFLTEIAKLKIAIAKLLLTISLLPPILGAAVLPIDGDPVEEPKSWIVAQEVKVAESWYVKFSSGEELLVPNNLLKTIRLSKGTDENANIEIRNKLKTKFQGTSINWDRMHFFFDKSGNIINVEQ